MVKVFIETSVFMRFLTADDAQKFKDCVVLFEKVEQGKIRPYVSNIVILEILFLLTKLYKFPKAKVLADIGKILNLRNLTLIEKTDTRTALKMFDEYNIKYADCLIAGQIPKQTTLLTYDEDFKKLKDLKTASPTQV